MHRSLVITPRIKSSTLTELLENYEGETSPRNFSSSSLQTGFLRDKSRSEQLHKVKFAKDLGAYSKEVHATKTIYGNFPSREKASSLGEGKVHTPARIEEFSFKPGHGRGTTSEKAC